MLGGIIAFVAGAALLFPNGFLEPMWRLNPHAQTGFARLGVWSVLLMSVVCVACLTASIGLWRGTRWGHRVATILIAINLTGDILNTVLGTEPRAIVGVPIAAAILVYLMSKRVRLFFSAA